MKIIIRLFFFLVVTTLIVSCESQKYISVVVVNEQTKEPLDSVFIKVMAGRNGDYTKNEDQGYTNSNGKFETYMMVGCVGGCYDIKINYSKENFKLIETINQIQDTVFLNPNNK